jgi:hypothetical protein
MDSLHVSQEGDGDVEELLAQGELGRVSANL